MNKKQTVLVALMIASVVSLQIEATCNSPSSPRGTHPEVRARYRSAVKKYNKCLKQERDVANKAKLQEELASLQEEFMNLSQPGSDGIRPGQPGFTQQERYDEVKAEIATVKQQLQ